ncbi:MAG: hypothetical protein RR704_01550 [Stenotrophomonas sp.]
MSIASPTPRLSQEVRATGLLALPLVLGHVSTGLISFVDNVIAGHHGTQTLAAVTIGTALLWLWAVDGIRPSRWDLLGVGLCLAGMMVIMFAPRSA